MTEAIVSERISLQHDLESFDSGKSPLDAWLRSTALADDRRGLSRTFVWHRGDGRVVAYYTLAPHWVDRDAVPKRLARGGPTRVSALLLARLALDRSLHGQKLGGVLLWEALRHAAAAADHVGGRMIVVDAIDSDAAAFYAHHGFERVAGSMRLVLLTQSVNSALGLL